MTEDELSPEEWREYKGERTPLSKEEQERRFHRIIKLAEAALMAAQAESQEEYGVDYEIRGIAIYGSWVDSVATEESDLDIITLSVGDPADLKYDIADRIGKKTGIMVENRVGENIDLNDKNTLKNLLNGKNEVVKNRFVIVTPYDEVLERIDEVRAEL